MTEARSNEEWKYALIAGGTVQETAISDLRGLLLRGVLFLFSHNPDDFERLSGEEILQLAEDCAQDALIAVLSHLSEFRGDSRFTTWAYKFAVNMALVASRRQRWKDVNLDALSSAEAAAVLGSALQENANEGLPDQSALQVEVRTIIQEVIEHDLTDRQRHVLMLMVFQNIPMDEVVLRLATNRNAIYKLLHDARRKVKQRLQARGFEVDEILALFAVYR